MLCQHKLWRDFPRRQIPVAIRYQVPIVPPLTLLTFHSMLIRRCRYALHQDCHVLVPLLWSLQHSLWLVSMLLLSRRRHQCNRSVPSFNDDVSWRRRNSLSRPLTEKRQHQRRAPRRKNRMSNKKPKPSTARKKMQSILTAEIFVSVRGKAMEPPIDDKGTSVDFFPEEMDAHDSEFNNQLTFQFNQKRKQSVLVWFAVFGCA